MASEGRAQPRVESLYDPELLTIEIGPDKALFRVANALICPPSKYFAKAFTDAFVEGQSRTITIEHVEESEFEGFVAWLYTKRLFWRSRNSAAAAHETAKPQTALIEAKDEKHPNDPVTWSYHSLFDLYILGDYVDCKEFRRVLLDVILIKTLQTKPREYLLPSMGEFSMVFRSLPDRSPLYTFAMECLVYILAPQPLSIMEEGLATMPVVALAHAFALATQLGYYKSCKACTEGGDNCPEGNHPDIKSRRASFCEDLCVCHEHDDKEERDACHAKWSYLKGKHGLDILQV